MPLTRLRSSGLAANLTLGNVTVSGTLKNNVGSDFVTAATASSGPKITNIQVVDSGYTVLDDTAVDTAGGNVKIIGSGFSSGCQVLIGSNSASATTFVSSTEVIARLPATAAGTYIVYLVNTDGSVAIRVNGVTFSSSPTWVTSSTLTGQVQDSPISIQLNATGASTYTLAAGSTLPTGVSLSNVGLLSGTVTGLTNDTTYNFTVVASDAEFQDSPRAFSVSITASSDVYGMNTVLLIQADSSSNGAQNNTFLDSSTNNFTITRNGNTTQGSVSPYGDNWSYYFVDGTGDYLSTASNAAFAFGTGDYTIEAWVYPTTIRNGENVIYATEVSGGTSFGFTQTGIYIGARSITYDLTVSYTVPANTWTHLVAARQSGTVRIFANGNLVGSGTVTRSCPQGPGAVGDYPGSNGNGVTGYISNIRVVKGTALYTTNFTSTSAPLTAVSGTSLLTCQSNRFIDNSTNNFALTISGDVRTTKFSPFKLSTSYSAETYGGSGYFDGTGDFLTLTGTGAVTRTSGSFTVEGWYYPTSSTATFRAVYSSGTGYATAGRLYQGSGSSASALSIYWGSSATNVLSGTIGWTINAWNHFAVTWDGTTTKIYINGKQSASGTSPTYSGTTDLTIGEATYSPFGYISNFRVTSSVVYNAEFTPTTTPLTAITGTNLLANFTNAGIFDNSTKNNIVTIGNSQINTSVKKYGTGSIYFDGTGDYLNVISIGAIGTANFTVEGWFYHTSAGQAAIWWDVSTASYADSNFSIRTDYIDSSRAIYCSVGGVSTTFSYTNAVVFLNNWVHVALVRNGNSLKLYLNGNDTGTTGTLNSTSVDLTNFKIAGAPSPTAGYSNFTGYIDDFRFTRGVARYTANFTPPIQLPAR